MEKLLRANQEADVTYSLWIRQHKQPGIGNPQFCMAQKHRSTKAAHPLPYEPAIYLRLEQTVRWGIEVTGGPLSPPLQPPQPAPAREDQTDSGHAPSEPQRWPGGLLGKTAAARLYALNLRPVPLPAKERPDGGETAKFQVYSQAL